MSELLDDDDDIDLDLSWLTENKVLVVAWRTLKWSVLQIALLYLMPWLGEQHYGTAMLTLVVLYTGLYNAWMTYAPKAKRFEMAWLPYAPYLLITLVVSAFSKFVSLPICIFLPLFGLVCFLIVRLPRRLSRKRLRNKIFVCVSYMITLIVLFNIGAWWHSRNHGSYENEKGEVLQRREFLKEKLLTTPQGVLAEMPSGIGEQFQGEYALYSCSMFLSALRNIAEQYPELKDENIQMADSLIKIAMSPELRRYDKQRWGGETTDTMRYLENFALR